MIHVTRHTVRVEGDNLVWQGMSAHARRQATGGTTDRVRLPGSNPSLQFRVDFGRLPPYSGLVLQVTVSI